MARENDTIDRRLLALLQANARESTATLARKLGVARTTVQERLLRLQRNGTIAGYSVVLRRDPFAQHADVVVLLNVTHKRLKTVVEALRTFPEVKLCQTVSGDHEVLCRVRVPQLEDVQPVLEALGEIAGVDRVRSIMVLSTNFDRTYAETASLASMQAAALEQGEAG